MKRVVLFGGNGYIGNSLVKLISKEKPQWEVKVASRRQSLIEGPSALKSQKISKIQADITDYPSILSAIKNADAVVNLVGIMDEKLPKYSFERVQKEGAQNIAKAIAETRKNCRLVHISAIGASDESDATRYCQTKYLGETGIKKELMGSNSSAVIIRPGLVIGKDDQFINRFVSLAKWLPVMPVFGSGQSLFQPIYVKDLARLIMNSIEVEDIKRGSSVILEAGGSKVYRFSDLIFQTTRRAAFQQGSIMRRFLPPYFLNLPLSISLLSASLFESIFPPGNVLRISRDQVRMLQVDNKVKGSSEESAKNLEIIDDFPKKHDLIKKLSDGISWKSLDDVYKSGWIEE